MESYAQKLQGFGTPVVPICRQSSLKDITSTVASVHGQKLHLIDTNFQHPGYWHDKLSPLVSK